MLDIRSFFFNQEYDQENDIYKFTPFNNSNSLIKISSDLNGLISFEIELEGDIKNVLILNSKKSILVNNNSSEKIEIYKNKNISLKPFKKGKKYMIKIKNLKFDYCVIGSNNYIFNNDDIVNNIINNNKIAIDAKDKNFFNWQQYIINYEDLKKAKINTPQKAWNHWIKFGMNEGRTFNKIDNIIITKNEIELINKLIEDFNNKSNLNENNINCKILLVYACHITTQLKFDGVKNNLKYFEKKFIDIVFIDSIESIYDLSNLSLNVIKIFKIPNDKYTDFGKWNHVLNNFSYENYDYIIFTNDSYILTYNIDKYLKAIIDNNCNLYAYTESSEKVYHYQSYLFTINKSSIIFFIELFNQYKDKINNYDDIIKYYEFNLFNSFDNCNSFLKIIKPNINIFFSNDFIYSKLLNSIILPIIKIKRILKLKNFNGNIQNIQNLLF